MNIYKYITNILNKKVHLNNNYPDRYDININYDRYDIGTKCDKCNHKCTNCWNRELNQDICDNCGSKCTNCWKRKLEQDISEGVEQDE